MHIYAQQNCAHLGAAFFNFQNRSTKLDVKILQTLSKESKSMVDAIYRVVLVNKTLDLFSSLAYSIVSNEECHRRACIFKYLIATSQIIFKLKGSCMKMSRKSKESLQIV